MDITAASPAEIDEMIATLNASIAGQHRIISGAKERIERQRTGAMFTVPISETELLRIIEAARSVVDDLFAERRPLIDEWKRRDGWTRYFLVDSVSGNGHVHCDDSSYRCSRTNRTAHYWLTAYSGTKAEEVVELAGERACTVCFPWAPVNTLATRTRLFTPSEVERAAAREAKAVKAAARDAKKITNPDGSPLRVGDHQERITSVVGAERAAVDICVWARIYRRPLGRSALADIEWICVALAAKRGTSPAAELVALQPRYEAKCKREGVTP